jgi:very-short-patch-repair endonuclease
MYRGWWLPVEGVPLTSFAFRKTVLSRKGRAEGRSVEDLCDASTVKVLPRLSSPLAGEDHFSERSERKMGEGSADSLKVTRARKLRREQTDAERKLWWELRARRLDGFKFKRQVPIGRYIADFMCFECKLIVELDGSQHLEQVEYDEARTRWLEAQDYRVVRYWNIDVLLNTERVMEEIWSIAEQRRPGRRD